jgi:putative aldouronate transport system permease protein
MGRINKRYQTFHAINMILLLIGGATMLFPLLHIIAQSLSSSTAIVSGRVWVFPVEPTFRAYESLIAGTPVLNAIRNSVVITIGGTLMNLFFSMMVAYPLSRPYFYARKALTLALVFTMLFGGGLIPSFLLVRGLGLINTYGALWFPSLVSVYLVIVLKTYLEGIPDSLDEASRIDGATEWQILGRIYVPLAVPALAALALFYSVFQWNQFRSVLLYINDVTMQNLNVLIQDLISSQRVIEEQLVMSQAGLDNLELSAPESVRAAGIVVLVLPIMLVYPFLQKHFVKGVLIGSIKG